MTRRVVSHNAESIDREKLIVVTCYEEGISKQQVKRMSPYSKKHEVLVSNGCSYEFLERSV